MIVLIVSGHFVCKVLEEVWEEWKCKREYRKSKKVCRKKNSDRVCETPPKKEKETIHEKRNANIERLLTAFPFFFVFPIVFFLYLFSISSIYFGVFGIIALDVFSNVIIWVMCSGTILLFLLWLLQEDKQAYFWIWFVLVPMDALIFTQAFHMNLKDFFSWNSLGILLVILVAESTFLFFLKIFISLAQIVWASIEKRISAFLGRETGNLKTLCFLLEIVCCTFGMFILLLIMSQPALHRNYYPVVYENGANGNILGVAIYQDDTTLIVLPAEKSQEDGILYELTGDTNYMYVDKSGVVIEQVSKDDIDWKNHLNVGQDSNIT